MVVVYADRNRIYSVEVLYVAALIGCEQFGQIWQISFKIGIV
jgi:hypothetical protein